MKLEKLVLGLAVTAFVVAISHSAAAATNTTNKTTVKKTATKKAAAGKSSAKASTAAGKKTAAKKGAKTQKVVSSKTTKKQVVLAKNTTKKKNNSIHSGIDEEINQEIRAYEKLAAVSNPLSSEETFSDVKEPGGRVSIPVTDLTPKTPTSPFSGTVNFSVGHDNNIAADKEGIEGTFYQIDPTLNFKAGNWNGTIGANIKDYSEQEVSNVAKTSEAKASFGYTGKISEATTSNTTLSALYHDEKWPDYINGPDINGIDNGMPIRYTQYELKEVIGFNFGAITTEIGGSATHVDNSNLYSDYAPDIFLERRHERDYNAFSAFGKVALSANEYVEIAARPSITQKKYEQREGRQPTGAVGGLLLSAPKYEHITSELALDLNLKFLGSTVTPTAVIGQVSDEALGAEDQSYYGFGLTSNIVLNKDLQLTVSPNVMYKRTSYDNWTDGIEPGEKRLENDIVAGVRASVMLTKNFGLNASYDVVREKSNKTAPLDTSENYRQEIVSSGVTFAF